MLDRGIGKCGLMRVLVGEGFKVFGVVFFEIRFRFFLCGGYGLLLDEMGR